MKIRVEIVERREALAKLRQYSELTGNAVEIGVKEIGIASARALASKVQPFGLNKVDKFAASIQAQVKRAIKNANLQGDVGNIEASHKSRRNAKGQVSKDLKTKGQYPKAPYNIQQRVALQKRKADNAGMAKGAWVEAGNSLVTAPSKARSALKRIKVPQLIERHAHSGNGQSRVLRMGINTMIWLTNRLTYIQRAMKNSQVQSALKSGMINGYKKIDQHIKRETKRISKI